MAYDVQKLLDIALNEVGYLEKETYDQLDGKTTNAGDKNYTKYQRDLAKLSYFNSSKKGVAWCAVFVAWCFVQAFGKAAALKLLCQPSSGNCGAGCTSQMNYYKNKKQFYTDDPQPGDQIIFWSKDKTEASHTGLVYKVDNAYVYTVEGNTSSSSGVIANGGAVAKKKYKLTYDRIAGYGRPNYGVIDSKGDKEVINSDTAQQDDGIMKKGDKGDEVRKLQQRLKELGYYNSTLDGSYGNVTMTSIKKFQNNNGLDQTGIADLTTQEKLYSDSAIDSSGKLDVDDKKEIIQETVEIPGMVTGDAWVSVKKGSTVNYRQRPNKSAAKVIGMPRIKQGEQVYIKISDDTWAAVEYKGYNGYIMMEFLTQEEPTNATENDDQETVEVPGMSANIAFVNGTNGIGAGYRQRPNASAAYVVGATYIPNGEQVNIKTSDGTWAAVEYKNYRGYVMMKDLVQDKKEEIADTEKETTEQRTYTTVQGDTLWKIASIYLGSGLKYKEIMKANGMRNTIVRPGMVLKIPDA